jgi:outer membrane receptor for ferrienterochelin and colicins
MRWLMPTRGLNPTRLVDYRRAGRRLMAVYMVNNFSRGSYLVTDCVQYSMQLRAQRGGRGVVLPHTGGMSRIATCFLLAALLLSAATASAQTPSGTVSISVVAEGAPIADARVSSGSISALTDERGLAVLRLAVGEHTLRIAAHGLRTRALEVRVRADADTLIVVPLEVDVVEIEQIIVSSTRTERRIEDEPMRVEVIGREEVEEKMMMTPGDISMLLNETAGLRVQPTAPALGGAGVRIQGLRGRYTQILSDGLPLHGGQTGALGPLQIPPMDLAQVEVIKGAASALYGASALGGVVNLLSRRPAEHNERELLLNQSTLGGTDVVLWNTGPLGDRWGYTLLGGGHRQAAADEDDDGWADLPAYRRVALRPRLFWNSGRGGTALITVGAMIEDREGGTMPGSTSPAGTDYIEALETGRFDAGLLSRFLLRERVLLSLRGSGTLQRHTHQFGDVRDEDEHRTGFAELALSGGTTARTWVAGIALQHDDYVAYDIDGFDYTFTVPGIFAQSDYAPVAALSLSASARLDIHSAYGTFLNPRISLLVRPADEWTVRASAGTGYFAPTPWTDETEAVGLRRVVPLAGVEAERARTASLDVARAWGPLELNATLFGSRITSPIQTRLTSTNAIELFNADRPVRTHGTELLARYHAEGLHITATHVYMRATEPDPTSTGRREVPLTPRHTAGLVAAWEHEGEGRIGVEFYYTGRQSLEENPFRTTSARHVIVGFLVERRVGAARVFLNAENVFDTRQTRHDPLVLPARSPDGRWTTDVWAPLEGRAFNAGVRWQF